MQVTRLRVINRTAITASSSPFSYSRQQLFSGGGYALLDETCCILGSLLDAALEHGAHGFFRDAGAPPGARAVLHVALLVVWRLGMERRRGRFVARLPLA